MGEATEMKLKIHFGGSMKKDGEGYAYVGETGTKNVEWKIDEITWERFSLFCKEDSLIRAPIGLLWFKFEKEEMKDLRYAYDYLDEEMRILRSAGKLGVDVVEVFVEHIPNTEQDERSCSDEDEEVDRPKEDDEPEESEDENPTIQDIPAEIMTGNEAATGENQNENDDVGDELVVDAADGGSDSRFKSIFDEVVLATFPPITVRVQMEGLVGISLCLPLLINHEEKAARKAQEDKLQEWSYSKRTTEMIAEYERGQEKEAKKSRPERDKWKKPVNKEATRSYLGSRSNEVKPSNPKKAVQKPQSKPVVETPTTRTEEKRNKVLEEDQEAKDIEPELSTVYVRAKSKDDLGPIFDKEEEPFKQWTMDDDFDPIFDEEDDHLDDDLGPIFDEEDDQLDDDSGLFFDEEKEPEAPFVCKEYNPVKLLRHEEGLQHFIFEPGEKARDQSNNNQSLAK
ncbi:hypothetical protein YC2023_084180 [Brassica napus]